MSKKMIAFVKKEFKDEVIDTHSRLGNDTVIVRRDRIAEIAHALKTDPKCQMNFLRDLTAVDYYQRVPRFEVVYIFYSIVKKHMLTVRVPLEDGDEELPTLSSVYHVANWLEREVYDMYGIRFNGHPDLRRVLLYEEFEGHPLRKDYDKQHSQPRTELRAPERDSVEEFYEFYKKEETTGSRDNFASPEEIAAITSTSAEPIYKRDQQG